MRDVERDILREKAAVLGRIAGLLEAHLAELQLLSQRAQQLAGAERAALRERLRELRREAERQRWFLVVQREANGLPDRGEVDREYPLPPLP